MFFWFSSAHGRLKSKLQLYIKYTSASFSFYLLTVNTGKELLFRKRGFSQDIALVNNIPECSKLNTLGIAFQENQL